MILLPIAGNACEHAREPEDFSFHMAGWVTNFSKEGGNLPFPGIHLRFTGFNLSVFQILFVTYCSSIPESPGEYIEL